MADPVTSDHPDSTPAGVEDHAFWREYPVGPLTQSAFVFGPTVVAWAAGLASAGAVVFLLGLLGEEGMLPELTAALDLLTRMALAVCLVMGYLCVLGYTTAHSVRSIGVSRALARAAQKGADPRAVPHPTQVEQVVVTAHRPLLIVLGIQAGVGALLFPFAVASGEGAIAGIAALVGAGSAAGVVSLRTRSRAAQRRRRQLAADHWGEGAEAAAWRRGRELAGPQARGRQPRDAERSGALRWGSALSRTAAASMAASITGVYGYLLVRFPGSGTQPARLADREEYSPLAETILDGVLWVAGGLGLATLGFGTAAGLIGVANATARRSRLGRGLDDPAGPRPPQALLVAYAERHPSQLGQAVAGVGAFTLVPTSATWLLATFRSDTFPDSVETFAGLGGYAGIGAGAAVLLMAAGLAVNTQAALRGRELRDRLQQRWPTLPEPPDDEDGPRYQARTGPTLRRTDL